MIAIKKACGVNWIYAVNATRCISIIAVLAGRVKGFFIKIWVLYGSWLCSGRSSDQARSVMHVVVNPYFVW